MNIVAFYNFTIAGDDMIVSEYTSIFFKIHFLDKILHLMHLKTIQLKQIDFL